MHPTNLLKFPERTASKSALLLGLALLLMMGYLLRAQDPPPVAAPVETTPASTNALPEEVQLSFQGANVDMVVQWLAQTTGKNVIKHPRVQCQLTIVGTKKIPAREAVTIVYRALSMEGFTAIETSRSIMLVPEGQEPKISPEFLDFNDGKIPAGRQRLVKIFPLKHIQASEIKEKVKNLLSEKGTVDVDEQANQIIVTDYNDNLSTLADFLAALDEEKPGEKIMRTFPLKNADATDVAKQLKELSSDSDSSSSTSRSGPYIFMPSMPSQKIPPKFSVVADRRRNSLVVQAPPTTMESLAKMIEVLDEPVTDGNLAPRIIQLKFVSALDVEDVLNELFLKKTQARPYFNYYGELEDNTNTDRDQGRLYGKVRITSEPYSNTIIITSNSAENMRAVEEVIQKLDVPSDAGESTFHLGLKFAKAHDVANSINILFAKNGSPPFRQNTPQVPGANPGVQQQQQQQAGLGTRSGFDLEQVVKEDGYFPWLGGQPDNFRGTDSKSSSRAVSDLVGRVRVVADHRSNSLLVTANVHFFPQIIKLINELDAPTEQVLIEARLLEVSSDFLDRLGVRWTPDGDAVFTAEDFDNSIMTRFNSQYQKGFGGKTEVNTPSSSQVAQALTSLRSGVLSSSISMDFLIQFLRKTTDATVLAEPQINIRNNETGRLFVGRQVPIPDNTQVNQLGGQNTTIRYKDVGVVLEVTPHINVDGDVELSLHTESSTVVPGQIVLGGAVFDTRNFRTDLTAKSGETLVVGGIIQHQVSDTMRKTPLLGNIPGLGWFFKKKDKTVNQVELMVFLRPRVIRNQEDADRLLKEVDEKAPLIKNWRDEEERKGKPIQKRGR